MGNFFRRLADKKCEEMIEETHKEYGRYIQQIEGALKNNGIKPLKYLQQLEEDTSLGQRIKLFRAKANVKTTLAFLRGENQRKDQMWMLGVLVLSLAFIVIVIFNP